MFELLFKFPLEAFREGRLLLAFPAWQLLLMPLAVFALAYVSLGYFYVRRRAPLRDRIVTTCLRSLALGLVIFSMTRPQLEVTSAVPQPSVVGVLLDNSLSMSVEPEARGDFVRREFDAADGDLLRALKSRFDIKLFRYGGSAEPVGSVDALDFGDGDSNLAGALAAVGEMLRGEPLAGLVVVGDGAAADSGELQSTLRALRAAAVPVYTIGLGSTRFARDVELGPIDMPRHLLQRSRVIAEVPIRQSGYDGEVVELVVEDDSRILHKQQVTLNAARQTLQVPLTIEDSGARALRFELGRFDDELIAHNNVRLVMPTVEDEVIRVLYFEGEPRFEFKFVRRAVAGDDRLRVTGLMRTADAKFYRVGLESAADLRHGFPLTRDELFVYDVLILGSVEVSLLSQQQQQMIVDFVSRRGGGLLMLGGRHAFAEGGYADSVISDLAPVVIADEAQPEFSRQIKIRPSAAAWVHPALLLDPDPDKSIARWQTLPRLTIVNPLREVKPGASLLLSSTRADGEAPWVALAAQRFGRGKVAAFAVQNSWLWQMHHEIALDDMTHERLWRQLLRWLAEDVPARLSLNLDSRQTHVGGRIEVRSEARDSNFEPLADARLQARITLPDGSEQLRPLRPHPTLAGVYRAEVDADAAGDYWLRVELEGGDQVQRSSELRLRASPAGSEYFSAHMNRSLLGDVAAATGGRFFTAADADELIDVLGQDQRAARVLARHELWDMPIVFLLLVVLLCAEWGYRRWRGLA